MSDLKPSILINDLAQIIEQGKREIETKVNSTVALVYWQVGKRISSDILGDKRAIYGQQVVLTISQELKLKYGNSFSEKNLRRMMQFAEIFPDYTIVAPLARQLN